MPYIAHIYVLPCCVVHSPCCWSHAPDPLAAWRMLHGATSAGIALYYGIHCFECHALCLVAPLKFPADARGQRCTCTKHDNSARGTVRTHVLVRFTFGVRQGKL